MFCINPELHTPWGETVGHGRRRPWTGLWSWSTRCPRRPSPSGLEPSSCWPESNTPRSAGGTEEETWRAKNKLWEAAEVQTEHQNREESWFVWLRPSGKRVSSHLPWFPKPVLLKLCYIKNFYTDTKYITDPKWTNIWIKHQKYTNIERYLFRQCMF